MNINNQLKQVIYWIGLGVSLVMYAHANFSTTKDLNKIEKKVDQQATKQDIRDLSNKIDILIKYLLENK